MSDQTQQEDEQEAIERGRVLFAGRCEFVAGAASLDRLPPPAAPEIAFVGRSNVGKSSLVNALTGRRSLARTSHTPGRTQQLNFFDLEGRLMLVDLPGYGYAKASKRDIAQWSALVRDYLRGRADLKRLCLLIDARHGPKESDEELMQMLDEAAVSFQAILTKIDKVKASALESMIASTTTALARHVAAHPRLIATSAREGIGIPALRAELEALAASRPLG